MDTIYHDFGCMVMRCVECAARHYREHGCIANEVETIEDDFSVICDDCGETIERSEEKTGKRESRCWSSRCVIHTADGCSRYDDNESGDA